MAGWTRWKLVGIAGVGALLLGCQAAPAPAPAASNAVADLDLPGFGATPGPTPTPDPGDAIPNVPLAGSFLFFEDFEHGDARWTLAGGANGIGWLLLHAPACGGDYTMLMGRPDQAPFAGASGEAVLTDTAGIDLTTARDPYMSYDVMGSFEPATAFTLTPELQDATGSWQPLGTPLAGRYPTVKTRIVLLKPYCGQVVHLRFRASFQAPYAATKGFYLDNVQVVEPAGP